MVENKEPKPGDTVKDSGIYEIIGPRGGKTGKQVALNENNPFPPTPKPNQTFKIVHKAKHKK